MSSKKGPVVDIPHSTSAVTKTKGHPDGNWKGAGANVKTNKPGPDRKRGGKKVD